MNIKDIARIAGVSTSTVSKIINGKDQSISQDTRDKVLKLVRQYGYTPYAKAGRNAKTWTIGVILRSTTSFDTALDGMIQTAQADGYGILVFNSYSDREQELKNINAVCSRHKVDGIIWQPVDNDSLQHLKQLKDSNVSELTIGPYGGDPTLLLPYRQAAYRLTEELFNRGHRGIGCLLTQGRRTADFLEGFRQCLYDHAIPFDDSLVYHAVDETITNRIANGEITGFVSSHYRMAVEFIQFMHALHYRVPGDVSLVSIRNDTSESLRFPGAPDISTYTIRNADFGSYLCAKLINTIERRDTSPASFVQSFHLDNTATLAAPFAKRSKRILVIGSITIDTYLSVHTLPKAGVTVPTQATHSSPGGRGFNEAIGVAKFGVPVMLLGNVGTDTSADLAFRELTNWNVDTTGVRRRPHTETGKSYIFVDSTGNSMSSLLPGANGTLSAQDILENENLFEDADYCLIQTDIPLDASVEACKIAHRHGAMTILRPSSCSHIPEDMFQYVDILIPSIQELELLYPNEIDTKAKVHKLLDAGANAVIVTYSEHGCDFYTHNRELHLRYPDASRIDATNASDQFTSAIAAYLAYGESLESAVGYAAQSVGYDEDAGLLIDRTALRTASDANLPKQK